MGNGRRIRWSVLDLLWRELGGAKECSLTQLVLAHRSVPCKSDCMLDGLSSLGGLERDQ